MIKHNESLIGALYESFDREAEKVEKVYPKNPERRSDVVNTERENAKRFKKQYNAVPNITINLTVNINLPKQY